MGRKYLGGVKAAQKRYRGKIKESLAAYQKAYYEAHKEERRAYMRAYMKTHRDKAKEYQREYYHKNKEILKAKREGLEPIVTDNITFDLSFESSLKNIQAMYNSVLQKYNKLLSDYSNLKWRLDQKSKELEQLKNERAKNEEWKNKIKKFFNI